jgi:zinc protease
MAGYRAPAATHPDFFPLAVIDTLLGGPRSMSLFEGAVPARTARLYRALVDTGLASEASSFLLPTVEPYLFTCSATLREGHTLEELEAALLVEVERLAAEPVSREELRRAVHQTRAQFVYSTESATSQGFWLGFAEMVADLEWLDGFLDSLAAVTAQDVQRVAQTRLVEQGRTVGLYVPTASH